jgi:hypothetical protein
MVTLRLVASLTAIAGITTLSASTLSGPDATTTSAYRSMLATVRAASGTWAASAEDQQQSCPAMGSAPLPLKYKGPATVPAITACDLMTRLYIFSDDSMLGRRVGTADNLRATAYIEREVRRMGLKPAGDSGGYFQYLPVFERRFDSASGDHRRRHDLPRRNGLHGRCPDAQDSF